MPSPVPQQGKSGVSSNPLQLLAQNLALGKLTAGNLQDGQLLQTRLQQAPLTVGGLVPCVKRQAFVFSLA